MKKLTLSAIAKPSRKVLLTAAAILATTGAVGAAALISPANFELSRIASISTAQTAPTFANEPTESQLPFDRVAQAPTSDQSTPEPNTTAPTAAPGPQARPSTDGAPTAQSSPTSTPAPAQIPSARRAVTQAPGAPAPTSQTPIAQTPIARAPAAPPQGHMVPTSSPGVIVRQQARPQVVFRPRTVYISQEYCD